MPVPAAVALSSLAFGMVHLTPRDFPQVRLGRAGTAADHAAERHLALIL